jgi:hypothetical protein
MSQRELEAVIGRVIVDQEFRMELLANLPAALAGYDLSEAEAAALRSVDAGSLDACGSIGRQIRQTSVVSLILRSQEAISA